MDAFDEELPPSTSSDESQIVDVSEVHFYLNPAIRISRTCRMNWFLDYRFVNFSLDTADIKTKDFVIYGAETIDGASLAPNSLLRMTPTTTALFFAGFYKTSIVVDLSPGCFAADDCGEILYTNMLPALKKLIVELVTPFKFSNNIVVHYPKICVTLLAYTPFVNFEAHPVLLHGHWVTLGTVDQFLQKVETHVRKFIDTLCDFMHPINVRREASEAACYRMKLSDIVDDDLTQSADDFPINDKVSIDFRLIQMIRLGMLGIQISPKSAHANVLIVTDGVLYIPDQQVIQSIALGLRANGVALSFLQVTTENTSSCLGLVPSSDLLNFLAKISFGTHFTHENVYNSGFIAPGNGIQSRPNAFQKQFLAWSCQREPYQIDEPLPKYVKDLVARSPRTTRFKCDFFMLFHVRLREGYSLRSLTLQTNDNKQYIVASFCLPWSVDVRINYKITALYADIEKMDMQNIVQEVRIETNYLPTNDSLDTSLMAALFLRESEEFAIKVLGFRFNPKYYDTKDLTLRRYPGLYVFLTRNRPFPTLAIKNLDTHPFNLFWQPLLVADSNALRRCCHIICHRFSMPFFVHQPEITNFWPELDSSHAPTLLKPLLMNAIYDYFASTTTFCLAAKYSYVKIIRDENYKVPPNSCYLIRVNSDSSLLIVKIIFLGDWVSEQRNRISNKIRRDLKELPNFEGLLTSLAVGTDAKLVRYRKVPNTFDKIMALSASSTTEPCWSTRQNIHQLALGKFLIPCRHIYKVEKDFDDFSFGQVALEGMNYVVRRRLLDGYRIGFRESGITNFIREIVTENDIIDESIVVAQRGSRLDQCIIFPALKRPLLLKGTAVQQLRDHLHVVGKSLVIQNHILDISPETSGEKTTSTDDTKTSSQSVTETVPGPSILKKDEPCCPPVAVVEGLEVLAGVIDDWSTGVSLQRRGSQSTPDRISLLESAGLKAPEKREKDEKSEVSQDEEAPKTGTKQTVKMVVPTEMTVDTSDTKEPPPVLPESEETIVESVVIDEEYVEKGCFIVTEYWTEPTEAGQPPAGNVATAIEEDQSLLSVMVTFRAMQVELDRAPGIGTALIGAEPYSTRVKPCPAVEIGPNVFYHPHLYNIVKMCRCGERRLMMFPTLKYVYCDPNRNNRLGRILDSFNRELRSYMPQYFDFEDHDGAWLTLATGLEDELSYIDKVELEEAKIEAAEAAAAEAAKKEAENAAKKLDSQLKNDCVRKEPCGTPTGYNSSGSKESLATSRNQDDTAGLLAKMDFVTLKKQVLGEYSHQPGGSKQSSTNSPKSMDGSVSSTMAPAGLEDDDDDSDAPFLPSASKKPNSLAVNPKVLGKRLSIVSASQNKNASSQETLYTPNGGKKKSKKKKSNAAAHASYTSFDRESIRSGKVPPEEQNEHAPLAFSVYYKRRDAKTVVVVIVPATCRTVVVTTNSQVPRLPVLAFLIEEDRLLEIFHKERHLPKAFPRRSAMNFCALNTLSALNMQVNAKAREPRDNSASPGMNSPFDKYVPTDSIVVPDFTDLTDFCGNIVHDVLFSRAYAHAAYHCLGIEVRVPQVVLKEVLEERCIQTSVKLDSIEDVLRVTCTHLSSYLQSKRCSRYRRHQMPNVAAYSDLSPGSESEIEQQQTMNPFRYSEEENDEICRMERKEFTLAFKNVLRQHKFYKIPNFGDYYYYWPKIAKDKKKADEDEEDEEKKAEVVKDYESCSDKTNSTGASLEVDGFDADGFEFEVQPLFLQIFVDLEHRDRKLNTYAVESIPNCLKDVLNTCSDLGEIVEDEKKALDEFKVKIEIFVLTIPGMGFNDGSFDERLADLDEDQFDARFDDPTEANRRPDIDLPKKETDVIFNLCDGIRHMLETEKILILSRYFDTQKSYRKITRVMRFVEEESNRIDDRTQVQKETTDPLFMINEDEGMRRLRKRLDGATFSYCKMQCVKDEHSKHRDKQTMVFYCCSVDDFDAFRAVHKANAKLVKFDFLPKKKSKRNRNDTLIAPNENDDDNDDDDDDDDNTTATDEATGSSTIIEKNRDENIEDESSLADVEEVPEISIPAPQASSKDAEPVTDLDEKVQLNQIIHDFWLLAKFESNYVGSYFFQRPFGIHVGLFKKFTEKLQAEIKYVNQSLLLEDMFERGEALPYLIASETTRSPSCSSIESVEYPKLTAYAQRYAYKPSLSESSDDVYSTNVIDGNDVNDPILTVDESDQSILKEQYKCGYFACPRVWHHWFGINPRLRKEPNIGILALMDGLENLQLTNRPNVYKVKDDNENIFYMSLFNDIESVKDAMPHENPVFIREVSERIESSVMLVVFGIAVPSTDVTDKLMKELQKRLDAKVLEELQLAMLKNRQIGLEPTDVAFIQHNPDAPTAMFYYSLPSIASEYLASVHTYLEQHLIAYFIEPNYAKPSTPRLRHSIDYYTPLKIKNCTREHRLPGSKFEFFPLDGVDDDPMPNNYEPSIFVVNKPKAEGQRMSGIGCFEVRLVDRRGKVIDRFSTDPDAYPAGKLGSDSFSLLYPGFSGAKHNARSNKFQEQTKCTLVESLKTDTKFISSEYFVAFYVWQVGDVDLQELKTRLRILCQQAMADVVFEFGVLSQPILELVPPPASPEEIAYCASPLNRQNSHTRTLTKRNSDAASCLQTTPSNLALPRPAPMAPEVNTLITPPTVYAVDTPSLPWLPHRSRTSPNAAWHSVANQGLHRIGYKAPYIATQDDEPQYHPKVTQFATPIRTVAPCAPEILRQDFVDSLNNFFNFMSRESQRYPDMSQSFSKARFLLDSERLAPTILRVIYSKFVDTFPQDNVVILKQLYTSTSQRLETLTDLELLTHHRLSHDKGHVVDIKDDFRMLDYVVVVQNRNQMAQAIQLSQLGGSPTPEMEELFNNPRKGHLNFGPKSEPFVPRRRLFFVTVKGEILNLFQYNMEAEIMQTVKDIVERTIFWNNARCRLLREIGLHKMQISHLTTLLSGDARDELYQPLKWKDPLVLVSYDYPPDNFRLSDYPKPSKELSAKFLRIFRHADPTFVLKHNSVYKFDDQVTQFLELRQRFTEDAIKMAKLKEAHLCFLSALTSESVMLEDGMLSKIIDRLTEVHYVETPVLLFPEWRKKVAPIRGTSSEHGSVHRRRVKPLTPVKKAVKKNTSLEAKMKPRSRTVTESMLPALCRTNSADEAAMLRLQKQMVTEYTQFLVQHLKLPLRLASSPVSPKPSSAPVYWLQIATTAGFILMQLSFVEPYFCLRIFLWDKTQSNEFVSPKDLADLNALKNSIVSKCHLHSFTYDFHLRIMSNYLTEDGEAPFSRGYNTSAFLVDFLQYYTCRPPSARNCIFEENCAFKDDLKVPGASIWEDFLKNDHKYAWKVVKLKVCDRDDADEYMLVSAVEKELFSQKYTVIRLVTNTTPPNKAKTDKELLLRFYVLMVAQNDGIIESTIVSPDDSAFQRIDQTSHVPEFEDEVLMDGELAYDSSESNSDQSALVRRDKLRSSAQSITSGQTSVSERMSDMETSYLIESNSNCPSPGSIGGTLIDDYTMTPHVPATFTSRDLSKRSKGSTTQIHRDPPRGHRKKPSGTYTDQSRILGQIPREQATYVQYVNSLQTSMQNELVIIADGIKIVLKEAVAKADHCCYVEHLWQKMLSSPSTEGRGLGILQRLESSLELPAPLKLVASTELTSSEWETFLSFIRRDPMEANDPRVVQCLAGVNFQQLFRFFVQNFEGEKRCRFFEYPHSKNLIISNCHYLQNSTLVEYRDNHLSMAFLYKYAEISAHNAEFVGDAISRQFDEVMRCLASFVWTDLLVNRPHHTR